MTVQEAANVLLSKFKGSEIIEAMPGNNRFIFCLKPANQPEGTIVMDSYYTVDQNGKVLPYPYLKYLDEWHKGMDHQYDIKKLR